MPECDVFIRSFHDRLKYSHDAVAVHGDEWKAKYCDVLKLFVKILRRTPLLERLAGGETVAYTFGELNSKMDGIFVGVGLLDSSARDQWKEDWSRGCEYQTQELTRLVNCASSRVHIREMRSEKKVTAAMMDMYTSTTGDQAGRLANLMQATLERLRVDLRLETRVITSETVSALQPASILSIFRWFIPERDVELVEGEPIGTGTYGTVNRGIWRCRGTTRNVIVKSLFEQSAGTGTSFLKQLQFWYELPKHPNIIRLFGGSHLAQKPFFVCEDASGGNIFQFFGKEENQGLFWSTFLQVAQGLKVLHDHHIVHDGLKSGNILIAKHNTPKISDFDCSHIRTMSASFSRETERAKEEAVRWKPREKLVEGDNLLPQFKSDVYSLGISNGLTAAMETTTRWLSEEHTSLSGASLGKIISTGLLLGVVHVLTGPDHLSALAAMTTGSSWRAFTLGIRWGCGHSIGLIFMALIFFAAGQTVDLDAVGGYLNYVVGFFMIALGAWTAVHVRKRYQTQLKEGVQSLVSGEGEHVDSNRASRSSTGATPTNLVELVPLSQRRVSSATSPAAAGASPQISMSPANEHALEEASASPSSSFHLVVKEDSNSSQVAGVGQVKPSKLHPTNWNCCRNASFENPATQKIMALLVGIIHGFAGPGGILGVLPAVVLNDWVKSVAYLGSFCVASIFIMGVFAALYGEVTGRIGGNSLVMEFRIGVFSAFFSFIVGVAWIGLQATGQMSAVFGE
ncbi:hypothetical protein JG688_00011184 [Phytophthora aleatoria]|uniref:Protein kinase domain-containing protein n=1 Tax=Phytophthora aleatoria TaxID=2496075 RepID=A0A8J5ID33_9STRA|nr:hypothetical protein JG688_00011184 [Phytophthora aleatoria]